MLDIDDEDFVSLMLPNGDTKDDLKAPENEIGRAVKAGLEDGKDISVIVVSAMGEEHIMGHKEAPPS